MTTFNLHDAGETLVHVHNALHHVASTLVSRVRPTQFRQIMQVDNSPSDIMIGIERNFVTNSADWQWTKRGAVNSEIVGAEVQSTQAVTPLVGAQSGYHYSDVELRRSVEMDIPLPQGRATAVMQKAQEFLEHVAAYGGVGTTLGSQLRGLYNVIDHNGTNPTAADATAGGTITGDWSNSGTDNAEIFADFMFLEDLAMTKTKDTEPPDTMVLPRSASLPFTSKNNTNTDVIVSDMCLKAAQSIRRIVYWIRGNAAAANPFLSAGPGVSDASRTVVGNFQNENAVRMVIAREPAPYGEAERKGLGFYQYFTLVTGGVLSDVPEALTTADGI